MFYKSENVFLNEFELNKDEVFNNNLFRLYIVNKAKF